MTNRCTSDSQLKNFSEQLINQTHSDSDDNDELILWDGWPSNSWKPYFQ